MPCQPRNNIMRLPVEARLLICQLLDDGATQDEIRNAPEIVAACAERGGLTLHGTTFIAYRGSAEFDEYRQRRRQWQDGIDRTRIAKVLVDGEGAAENIARVADFELLKICLSKLQSGDELEPKQLAAISRAVTSYNRNAITAEKEAGYQAKIAEKEAGYQAKIAELSAKIAELSNAAGRSIDSRKIADDLDSALGVR